MSSNDLHKHTKSIDYINCYGLVGEAPTNFRPETYVTRFF